MKSSRCQCFKQFDYFGVNFTFNVGSRPQFKSISGGVVFVTYICFAFSYICFNFDGFVHRNFMTVIYNQEIQDAAPQLSFREKEIPVAIGIRTDENDKLTEETYKYLYIEFKNVTMNKTSQSKLKNDIKFHPCTKSDFQLNASIDYLQIEKYYCVELNRSHVIQGTYTEDIFTYFEYTVRIKPIQAKDISTVRSLLCDHDVKMQVFFLDQAILVKDYHNPQVKYVNTQYLRVDFAFLVKIDLFFSQDTFESDENILLERPYSSSYISLSSLDKYYSFKGEDRISKKPVDYDILARMYFRSSQSKESMKRIYQKITEYLANMSAITSQILLLIIIVMRHINTVNSRQYVMKDFVRFRENLSQKNRNEMSHLREIFRKDLVHLSETEIENEKQELTECLKKLTKGGRKLLSKERYEKALGELNRLKMLSNIQNKNSGNDNTNANANVNVIGNANQHQESDLPQNEVFKVSNKETEGEQLKNLSKMLSIKYILGIVNTSMIPRYITLLPRKLSTKNELQLSPEIEENINIQMHFNICEIIAKIICPCCCKTVKKKDILYEKGLDRIFYHLDIINYFRKMYEIDIMKCILFSDDQQNLLKFLAKPSVSLMSNELNETYSPLSKTSIPFEITRNEIDQLYNSFKAIAEKEDDKKTQLENKILQLTAHELHKLILTD